MSNRLQTCLQCFARVGSVSLVLVLAACTSEQPLRVASHVWVGYEPMFLARSMGWLDQTRISFYETASA
ncbi:MAG TPA: hypothetical protein VKO38_02165, partial [Wenzhouxiangella sp.]|nr:hypothetical protein [Wenzhouxiangella sp.]